MAPAAACPGQALDRNECCCDDAFLHTKTAQPPCSRRGPSMSLFRNAFVVAAASAWLAIGAASAQESASAFPSQPIKVVIPAGAGGTLDVIARVIGQKLT